MKKLIHFCVCILISSSCATAQPMQLILPKGHSSSIQTIAVSKDDKYLLSASDDFLVILWNKKTGRIIKQFEFNENAICAIQFSNNQSFYILFANGVLIHKDLLTGKNLFKVQAAEQVNDFKLVNNFLYLYYKEVFTGLSGLLTPKQPKQNKIEIRNFRNGQSLKSIEGRGFIEFNEATRIFSTTNVENKLLTYNFKNEFLNKLQLQGNIDNARWANEKIIYSTKDGNIYLQSLDNNYKHLLQLNERVKTFTVDDSNKNFAVINGKEIIVMNIHDSTLKYSLKLSAFVDDIAFSKTKEELYFILDNGLVGHFNYTTKKGSYLKAHKGWNGKISLLNQGEFITSSDDNFFILWKAFPLTKSISFENRTTSIQKLRYNTFNNTLLTLNGNGILNIEKSNEFNFKTNAIIEDRIFDLSNVYADSFCILSIKNNKGVSYNFIERKVIDTYSVHKDSLQNQYTQGGVGEHGAIVFNHSTIIQYIPANNTLIFRNDEGKILHTQLVLGLKKVIASINSNYLLVLATNAYLFKQTADDNIELIQELNNHFDDAVFDFDEQKIIFVEVNKSNVLGVYDLEKKSTKYIGGQNRILTISNANAKNRIAILTIDSLKIINTNKTVTDISILHSLGTINAAVWKDDNTLILGADDGSIHFYQPSNQQLIYSIINFNDNERMIVTNSKFYFGSTNKVKLLSYAKGLTNVGFEQLDVKYNRPDKVLEAIGNTDTAFINSYRKAYQKRIKKLGIDTTQFKDGYSVPESDFINRDAIEYEQTNDKLILKIKGNDSSYKLDRFNVWVNEVPLFGLRGIKTKHTNNFDTTITITLSQGENRIETSITNVNGTESYKMPLFVKYTPAKPTEEKQYFVGIGINQFANPDYNLNWSVKDIGDLALKLKTKYPNIIIDTLFDSNVTKENVLALKQKLLQLKEDDKVIVSYSGHGVLSKDFDYYLSTYSINFNNPSEKGLVYDDLESLLDNIKPRKKLMLIDACHSGEVDKEEIAKIEAAKAEMAKNGIIPRSTIKVVPKKNLGMANSFELMQSLFVNVGKGTGATIISAAGGMQYAQERGDLKNGVFTYSLIEAFNQNTTLKVSELKKKVGDRVIELTNGLQKPTSRNETNNYDWVIW